MKIRLLLTLLVWNVLMWLPVDATAQQVIIATENARAEYEGGIFTAGKPEFRYRFEIDEAGRGARLTEVVRLRDGTVIDDRTEYAITVVDDGANIFSVSKERLGQRILTLVGKPGTLATEMIVIGETYFEYSKAASGRLYLASGTVQRPVSVEQDSRDSLSRPGGRK